jgi:HAD superfamily hydrolase (TIGR01509 family)
MGGMPRLVIFDCDGVLVDSEPISIAVLLEILAEDGLSLTEDVAYDRFLGRSMASIARIVEADFGLPVTGDHLAEMRARVNDRFRAELQPTRGIRAAIAALDRPYCVASSSLPDRIRLSLSVTGLIDLFEPRIFSSTMVANGKPAPDLFLHAAREMGADPADCLVIEDSPAGIEAARRAGMRVFSYVGGGHAVPGGLAAKARALGPDLIFDDMALLPGLIQDLAA